MAGFANVAIGHPGAVSNELLWLSGLLEAEGTFLRPPPSNPNCPIVSCRMTDRDVVERVAKLFGTRVLAIDKGQYRTEYAATLKGSRAVTIMTDIKPLMGNRRRRAIDSAVRCYTPPKRKLNFSDAEEIRRRFADGESVASLAISYNVARQTIYPILQDRLYRQPPTQPWRQSDGMLPEATPPLEISSQELYWLAGWLEGEGSFLAPPPSDPRRVRISGRAKDEDVVREVGRLFRIKPLFDQAAQRRNPNWSPMWRVLLQGNRAGTLMLALEPLMGARRQAQIRAAVIAAMRANQETRGVNSDLAPT